MARQTRTAAEITAVNADIDRFFLPFDASLDVGAFTTYGATDPAIDLSMVNVRHLKAYTQFRGIWVATPVDGTEPIGYVEGDIVASSTNNVVYRRSDMGLDLDPVPNPDPNSAQNTGHWIAMGIQVNQTLNTDAGPPGIFLDGTTLNFRGYRAAANSGVSIDNTTGTIDVTNFSLTDVRTYTTSALRNAATDTQWHQGDVAIVTGIASQSPDIDDGEGSYIYTGTNQTTAGVTTDTDWTQLAVPHSVVTSVAGNAGPTITAQQLADAVQPLTDLNNLNDVAITSPSNGQHLTYNSTTGNWENNDEGETSLDLNNISDVTISNPQAGQHLTYNATDARWENNAASETSLELDDLGNVSSSTATTGQVIKATRSTDASTGAVTVAWAPADDDNTTYTFANGTDGDFTVTPDSGTAQTVTVGHVPVTQATTNIDNSGRTVIQDLTLDDNGHVTAAGTFDIPNAFTNIAGMAATDTDTTITSAEILGAGTLTDIGDTDLANPSDWDIIRYRDSATDSQDEWLKATPADLAGQHNLGDVGDVPATSSLTNFDLLRWREESGQTSEWLTTTPSAILGQANLTNLSDVDTTGVGDSDLLTYESGEWVETNRADVFASQSLNRIGDVGYQAAQTVTTYNPLLNMGRTGVDPAIQRITTSPAAGGTEVTLVSTANSGNAPLFGSGRLNTANLRVGSIVFITTLETGFNPATDTTEFGPFTVVRISSSGLSFNVPSSGEGRTGLSSANQATINTNPHYVWTQETTITPGQADGDVLTWNAASGSWRNQAAGTVQLGNATLNNLSDVVYDDDVLNNLYPVAIAENSRDAADALQFEGIVNNGATLHPDAAATQNFESGTFAVGDQVYFSLNPPPLNNLDAAGRQPINGPYGVVSLEGTNPVFAIGANAFNVPTAVYSAINTDAVYYAYIEVPSTAVVRPADVLVRSADGNQWVNETAAQMAANPNGGIRIDNLRNVNLSSPANGQTLTFDGTNWVNHDNTETAIDLDNLGDVTISSPAAGQTIIFNGTNWVNHTTEETSIDLDNLEDVQDYPTRTAYFADGVSTSFTNAVVTFGAAFNNGQELDNVHFVQNDGFITIGSETALNQETYNGRAVAQRPGPYNLIPEATDNTNTMFLVFRAGESTYQTGEQAAINAELAAITTTTGITAVSARTFNLGPSENGEIIRWVQSERDVVTGAGSWQYERLADYSIQGDTTDIPSANLGNVALLNNAGTPTLQTGITAAEVRDVIDAGQVESVTYASGNITVTDQDASTNTISSANILGGGVLSDISDVNNNPTAVGQHLISEAYTDSEGNPAIRWTPGNANVSTEDLDSLNDVVISSPVDGQHLVYDDAINSGAGGWRNHNAGETSISLDNLRDVEITPDFAEGTPVRTTTTIEVGSANQGTPADDANVNILFTTPHGLSVGNLFSFEIPAVGPTPATERPEIFMVVTVTDAMAVVAANRDGSDTSTTLLNGLTGNVLQTVDIPPVPVRFAENELIAYTRGANTDGSQDVYTNKTPAEAGLITGVVAGDQTITPSSTGVATILLATPAADGIMSLEDKGKLDEIPETPMTVSGSSEDEGAVTNPYLTAGASEEYALRVTRRATGADTDPDSYDQEWVQFSEVQAQESLVFTETTGAATLTQYRTDSGAVENIRNIDYGTSGGFVINFATFTPGLSASGGLSRRWDQPFTNAAIGLGVSTTSPDDFPSRYVEEVSAISVNNAGNSGLSLTNFVAGAQSATPGGGVDWNQSFVLNAASSIVPSTTSGLSGGNATVTYTFEDNNDTNLGTRTQSITWDTPNVLCTFDALPAREFWERYTGGTFDTNISGISVGANVSTAWTGTSNIFDALPATATGISHNNAAVTFTDPIHTGTASTTRAITATSTFTRPDTVTGTEYTATDTATATVVPNFQPGPRMTRFTTAPTNIALDDLLFGDFNTGNGLGLMPGVSLDFSTTSQTITFTGDPRIYWFGWLGTRTPTFIDTDSNLAITQRDAVTITFNATNLNALTDTSNVPSTFVEQVYTFYGVQLLAGTNNFRIDL